ncbi:hypothetical protein ACRTEC_00580 [Janibacter indicus]
MTSRLRKLVTFVAAVVGFSLALAGGVWLFLSDGQPWPALFWGVVWGIAVVVTLIAFIGFLRETDPDATAGEHVVVAPPTTPLPPATDKSAPWPDEWLAPALATAFEGTPYVVRSNGHSVLVHADLTDARWQHLATRRSLEHAFVARFTPTGKPGVVKRTDESRQVESHAGVAGLGAQIAVSSGREFTYTRRKEWSLGLEGFRKQVDYEFSTAEINVPVKEILGRAGWREALDSETKGALVMGAMGLSALVLVPLALGVTALVG